MGDLDPYAQNAITTMTGHFKKECQRLKNIQRQPWLSSWNDRAPAKVYVVEWGRNPDKCRCEGTCDTLKKISCTKTQRYLEKGFPIFLAHVNVKEIEDKLEKKRLEDVPIVQDFPEVFPEDLPGLPPTRQVEFQIDLVPGAAPVARAPYRLAPSNKKEHEEHLKMILELLKKEELYAKFSKCEFWIPKVQFLGHVIDSEGIHVDPAKIESIKDFGTFLCHHGDRQFLGLAGYVGRRGLSVEWGDNTESNAFQLLKQKLCAVHQSFALLKEAEDFIASLATLRRKGSWALY
ncbi:hypothetical protein Tco_0531607 [Tanacetum coccineum]